MSMTLFEITDEFDSLFQLVQETGIEDPETKEQIDEFMADLVKSFRAKADSYASVIDDASAKAKAQKDEAERIRGLAKHNENKAVMLKEMLQSAMEQLDIPKLETDYHKFSIGKVGGKQKLHLHEDVEYDKLPEPYRKVEYKPNTQAIREAIENGEPITFAELEPRATTLRIK